MLTRATSVFEKGMMAACLRVSSSTLAGTQSPNSLAVELLQASGRRVRFVCGRHFVYSSAKPSGFMKLVRAEAPRCCSGEQRLMRSCRLEHRTNVSCCEFFDFPCFLAQAVRSDNDQRVAVKAASWQRVSGPC